MPQAESWLGEFVVLSFHVLNTSIAIEFVGESCVIVYDSSQFNYVTNYVYIREQ